MGSSATSQAAAVSALLRKKADVIPRPSGASNAREYAVIVRRGISVAAGASITVGADDWTADELEQVADRIAHALTSAGYYYHRTSSRVPSDKLVHFGTVYKPTHKYTEKMRYLISQVRQHAEANYERGGWDEVVEAWDDDDIASEIGKARTVDGAIRRVAQVVEIRHEHAEEIRATAF